MKISEVKMTLGKPVRLSSSKHNVQNGSYILTGCILRKDEKGNFYYLAELNDVKQKKCTLIVKLEEIKEEST